MTLIKCPKCGQTVLSVATTCPKCHHLLSQNPLQHGGESNLIDCPRCQKMIPGDTVSCEYCGFPVRMRRRLRRVAWVAVGVVILVAGGVVALQLQSAPTAGGVAVDVPPLSAPPTSVPIRDLPVRDTIVAPTDTMRAPARPGPVSGPAIPDSLRPPPTAAIRYVAIWGNVRTGRDTLSPSIRSVPPGTELLVANPIGGWWAVYIDSVFVGYMAGDLLSTNQPDTTSIFRDYR